MGGIAELTVGQIIGWLSATLIALTGVIEIIPIKLNPWSWLARHIGRAINREVIDKVDTLSGDVIELKRSIDERDAKSARESILEFGDELIYSPDKMHSKDRFDTVVQRITEYDAYCVAHPEFKNHMTESTKRLILKQYEKCMKDHSFL